MTMNLHTLHIIRHTNARPPAVHMGCPTAREIRGSRAKNCDDIVGIECCCYSCINWNTGHEITPMPCSRLCFGPDNPKQPRRKDLRSQCHVTHMGLADVSNSFWNPTAASSDGVLVPPFSQDPHASPHRRQLTLFPGSSAPMITELCVLLRVSSQMSAVSSEK